MLFDLSKVWIDIDCPKCSYANEIQMIDAKLETVVFCSNCKSIIHLSDDAASVHSSIEKADKAFKSFENALKNFGK